MRRVIKKNSILLLIVVVSAALVWAIYRYNEGPVDIRRAKGIPTTAAGLYELYYRDSSRAAITFTGKITSVNGIVAQVIRNQQNQLVVLLLTNETGAFINCTMEDQTVSLKEDTQVTLKGICTGIGAGDMDMGILGDVYLTRCYLSN
jgi:hypothetical protein